ncbi:hypothetical protein ACIBO2_32315 [Nonomuraea sp. NPDC050022]|uniref:hypothetical protein n=1 Tax=Nonomuraea sp. NPDC050022 TaxID=3364358 RepID=UPI00379B1187
MTLVEHHLESVRGAAQAGDYEAAREYGRLLSLLPAEMEESDDEWPCVWWFRVALEGRPEDHEAAVLLAARLTGDADALAYAYGLDDEEDCDEEGEDEEGNLARRNCERMRKEAQRLYAQVLRADPAHPGARSGLAAFEGVPFPVAPFSHYLVQGEYWSGTAGCREQLVVSDAEELQWACDHWFAEIAGLGAYHLSVYASGERLSHASLEPLVRAADGSLDWSVITIPPLPGEPLPHGHPALLHNGHIAHYGWYSLDLG